MSINTPAAEKKYRDGLLISQKRNIIISGYRNQSIAMQIAHYHVHKCRRSCSLSLDVDTLKNNADVIVIFDMYITIKLLQRIMASNKRVIITSSTTLPTIDYSEFNIAVIQD